MSSRTIRVTRAQWEVDYKGRNLVKKRADRRQALNIATMALLTVTLSSKVLFGLPLSAFMKAAHRCLAQWKRRMAGCGTEVYMKACEHGDHHQVATNCCHVPVCSWEEHRTAARMSSRGRLLMRYLPGSDSKQKRYVRYRDVRPFVNKYRDKIPKTWVEPRSGDLMSYRFGSINLRDTGDFLADMDRIFKVRRRVARFLSRHGQIASFISLDVGNQNSYHVHLHFLSYGPFISREVFERFHRSLDCTVRGCRHEPGDREHCNGSWEGDLRAAYSPTEVLKYACSWPDPGEGADGGLDPWQVALRLATFLASYKRHRIECYGLAKAGVVAQIEEELDGEEEFDSGTCPLCGGMMRRVAQGTWMQGKYVWEPYLAQME